MDTFEYAMQMEKEGEDYYRKLADRTENGGLKYILTMLADEEAKHYRTIKKMRTAKPQMPESKVLEQAKNVFVRMKDSGAKFIAAKSQAQAYKEAQVIEKKSREFYIEKADEAQQQYQKEAFLKLAEEEKGHYVLLENIVQFVSRPDSWLENAEFFHLDEY